MTASHTVSLSDRYYCHLNSPWFQFGRIDKVKNDDSSEGSKFFQDDGCQVMLWLFSFTLLLHVSQSLDTAQKHLL